MIVVYLLFQTRKVTRRTRWTSLSATGRSGHGLVPVFLRLRGDMAIQTAGRRSHDCRCTPRSAVSVPLARAVIVGFLVSLGICVYHVYRSQRRRALIGSGVTLPWKLGRQGTETYAEK